MLISYGTRILLQGLTFVFLARVLGAKDYGMFAAALSVANLFGPFVEMGSYSLIVKDVVAGIDPTRAVGNSLLVTILVLPVAFLIVVLVKPIVGPDLPWGVLLSVAASVFVGGKLTSMVSGLHVATGKQWRNVVVELVSGILSLLCVAYYAYFRTATVQWSYLYLFQSLIVGLLAFLWSSKTWGSPTWNLHETLNRIPAGLNFTVSAAVHSIYTDADKAMLARLSTLEATGVYAAAYRLVSSAALPLLALLGAIYPRFFEAGKHGPAAAAKVAKRILPLTLTYGVLAVIGVWLAAPWVGHLFGSQYAETPQAMRALIFVVVIQCLHAPVGDALTGSGFQSLRTTSQFSALILNILLNILFIPRYGWIGSAWATILSEALLCIFLMSMLYWTSRRKACA